MGQNISFCLKSSIEGHRINLLGSFVDKAQVSRQNQIGYLAGGLHAPQSRISWKIYFESLWHTLSFFLGVFDRFCNSTKILSGALRIFKLIMQRFSFTLKTKPVLSRDDCFNIPKINGPNFTLSPSSPHP